jgi:hypothetical protein
MQRAFEHVGEAHVPAAENEAVKGDEVELRSDGLRDPGLARLGDHTDSGDQTTRHQLDASDERRSNGAVHTHDENPKSIHCFTLMSAPHCHVCSLQGTAIRRRRRGTDFKRPA